MSKKDQESAFPHGSTGWSDPQAGMTLRDYFAAKVLQSLISSHKSGGWNLGVQGKDNEHISICAYAVADAMLAARTA